MRLDVRYLGQSGRHLGSPFRAVSNEVDGPYLTASIVPWLSFRPTKRKEGPTIKEVTTIGLDIAKNVFQVHGVNGAGEVVIGKPLRRRQVVPFFKGLEDCLIGVEACATSHHWVRALEALGHEVRMARWPSGIGVETYARRFEA